MTCRSDPTRYRRPGLENAVLTILARPPCDEWTPKQVFEMLANPNLTLTDICATLHDLSGAGLAIRNLALFNPGYAITPAGLARLND